MRTYDRESVQSLPYRRTSGELKFNLAPMANLETLLFLKNFLNIDEDGF